MPIKIKVSFSGKFDENDNAGAQVLFDQHNAMRSTTEIFTSDDMDDRKEFYRLLIETLVNKTHQARLDNAWEAEIRKIKTASPSQKSAIRKLLKGQ